MKAKEIKGSVLQLDIIQAEQYLAFRKLSIKSLSYIQVSRYRDQYGSYVFVIYSLCLVWGVMYVFVLVWFGFSAGDED